MFQFKPIDQSPILNFCKKKKRSITALSLASLSAATLAIITGIAPVSNQEPAMAWQSWEHLIANFDVPSNFDQARADAACRNSVWREISAGGGRFDDLSHGGNITFVKASFPNVWAHLGYRKCVINASWGYVHW
jgi:hypothetical protein